MHMRAPFHWLDSFDVQESMHENIPCALMTYRVRSSPLETEYELTRIGSMENACYKEINSSPTG